MIATMRQEKLKEDKINAIIRGRYFKKMKEVFERRRHLVRG